MTVEFAVFPGTHQSSRIKSREISVQTAVGIVAVIVEVPDDLVSDRLIGIPRDVYLSVFLAEIKQLGR